MLITASSRAINAEKKEPEAEKESQQQDVNLGLEYERYLKEVVAVLEKDDDFRAKLEQANETEIKNGKIAQHLKFVNHEVRSQLDELKRIELDRLRMLYKKKERDARAGGLNKQDFRMKFDPRNLVAHMDHGNPDFFGQKDLENLIKKATSDLDMIDKKREEEFKKYEMEKELLRRKEMEVLDEQKRLEEQKKFEESQKRHKDHPKLHEPGHKAQLEEVWEDDHEDQDFNPRTFFIEHDLNDDGLLDEEEIEALFLKEVEKMYNESEADDDMNEKYEELYRMRLKVLEEMDTNKDRFISMDEFLTYVKKDEFDQDEGWKGLDEEELFSEEELLEFEKEFADVHPEDKPPIVRTTLATPKKEKEGIPLSEENKQLKDNEIHEQPSEKPILNEPPQPQDIKQEHAQP